MFIRELLISSDFLGFKLCIIPLAFFFVSVKFFRCYDGCVVFVSDVFFRVYVVVRMCVYVGLLYQCFCFSAIAGI